MKVCLKRTILCLAAVAAICGSNRSSAQTAPKWVGTWSESPTQYDYPTGTTTLPATTFRNLIHISVGGSALRIKLSNELGTTPLQVGEVNVASSVGDGTVVPGTQLGVKFNGRASFTIPPGATLISDRIVTAVPAFANLAVSIYVPAQNGSSLTYHRLANQTNYQAAGDQASAVAMQSTTQVTSWFVLKAVDVQVAVPRGIVAYGDSITDGKGITIGANTRWPDDLANLLAASGASTQAVVNQGMGGDCLLSDTYGTTNAIERFSRDVLSMSGVKYVIVFIGTNDINQATEVPPLNVVAASDLTWALSQIAYHAHEAGLKVYVATITPAAPYPPAGQAMRTAVNQWILASGQYDAVFDFDAAVRDPNNPDALLAAYDSGDGVHLNDAGYAALANAIPLTLFQ